MFVPFPFLVTSADQSLWEAGMSQQEGGWRPAPGPIVPPSLSRNSGQTKCFATVAAPEGILPEIAALYLQCLLACPLPL